jgi:hypothetical protein
MISGKDYFCYGIAGWGYGEVLFDGFSFGLVYV